MSTQQQVKMSKEDAERLADKVRDYIEHPFFVGSVCTYHQGTENEYSTIAIFVYTESSFEALVSLSCEDDWERFKMLSAIVVQRETMLMEMQERIKAISTEAILRQMASQYASSNNN